MPTDETIDVAVLRQKGVGVFITQNASSSTIEAGSATIVNVKSITIYFTKPFSIIPRIFIQLTDTSVQSLNPFATQRDTTKFTVEFTALVSTTFDWLAISA